MNGSGIISPQLPSLGEIIHKEQYHISIQPFVYIHQFRCIHLLSIFKVPNLGENCTRSLERFNIFSTKVNLYPGPGGNTLVTRGYLSYTLLPGWEPMCNEMYLSHYTSMFTNRFSFNGHRTQHSILSCIVYCKVLSCNVTSFNAGLKLTDWPIWGQLIYSNMNRFLCSIDTHNVIHS